MVSQCPIKTSPAREIVWAIHQSLKTYNSVIVLNFQQWILFKYKNNRPRRCPKSLDSLIDSANLAPDPNFPSKYVTSQCYGQLREFVDVFPPHVPVYDLPRKTWVRLNKFRTACAKTYDSLDRFSLKSSPSCDCGHPRRTPDHLMKFPLVIPVDSGDLRCVNARVMEWLEPIDV